MKPVTEEWVEKAESDYHTALRELRARKHANYDAACFHAQQCIEKYLKAILIEREKTPPRIHDLVKLGEQCWNIVADLQNYEADFDLLSRYAVAFRYPGETASKEEAREAVEAMKQLRIVLRNALGLEYDMR